MRKYICAFAVVVILGCLSLFALLSFIFPDFDPCVNDMVGQVQSPDGQFKAVIFERDCGATTDFSTQVSIVPTSTPLPDTAGNVFVTDGNHGAAPPGRGGGPNVWVKWLNPKLIKIVYDKRAATYKMEKQYQNINITYEAQ